MNIKKTLASIALAGALTFGLGGEVEALQMKIYPTNDVYTDSSQPSSNFNTESLRVGNDVNFGKHRTYLQFDLSSVNGAITNASLSIDPATSVGSPNLLLCYVSNDGWNENSVTWNTAPTAGDLLGSQLVDGPNRIEFNVTESVLSESDGVLSLALTSLQESTGNIYAQFFSGDYEAGGSDTYWPYLEIESNESEPSVPEPSGLELLALGSLGLIRKKRK